MEQQQPDVESTNCIHFKHSDGHGLNTFAGKNRTVLKMFPVNLQYVWVNACQHSVVCNQSSEWQQLPAAGPRVLKRRSRVVQCWAAVARLHPFCTERWETQSNGKEHDPSTACSRNEQHWKATRIPAQFQFPPAFLSWWDNQGQINLCLDLCCLKTFHITREDIKWDSSPRIHKLTSVKLFWEHIEKIITVWQPSSSFTEANSFI